MAGHLAGRRLPGADVHHGADQRPGPSAGRTTRRRSRSGARPSPRSAHAASRTRRTSEPSGDRRPAAERREVVLAVERVAGQPHGRQVEGSLDVPGRGGREGVGHRPVEHRVAVAAAGGRRGGRRSRAGPRSAERTTIAGRSALLTARAMADQVDVGAGVEGHHLAPGVHAGVGAPGAGQLDGVAQVPLEGADRARRPTVALTGLGREAVEAGAAGRRRSCGPARTRGR